MSARTQLAGKLKTDLDKKRFSVIDAETLPDAISKPTVVIRHRDYTPAPNALGTMIATFVVTLVSAKTEPRAAEDDLDLNLPDVLAVLRTVRDLVITRATKVAVREQYFGFDISLTLPVNVTNP